MKASMKELYAQGDLLIEQVADRAYKGQLPLEGRPTTGACD
jgi:hypothetical protein